MSGRIEIEIPSLEAIPTAAARLIPLLQGRTVVSISGEMGAGKTTLIQAICKELGVEQVVTSPTFALINEYFTQSGESIFHFDLYRIEDPVELFDIGYEDYFYSDALCFIEWPEKAAALIPEDALNLKLEVRENGTRFLYED